MTGVAELLASAEESAPIQRVRNYHLTDRAASPRVRDFLTAMRRTEGAVCVRWAGPPGDCLVRYVGGDAGRGTAGSDDAGHETAGSEDAGHADWQRAEHNRLRGRTTVETADAEQVRDWLEDSRPKLVTYAEVRDAFEGVRGASESVQGTSEGVHSETGRVRGASESVRGAPGRGVRGASEASPRASADSETGVVVSDGGSVADGSADGVGDETRRPATGKTVRVDQYADLLEDPTLDRCDADALAAALPVAPREVAFGLPLVLAEESVLESVAGSDRAFVAEAVPERETDRAYYVRQNRRGAWVPKAEATVYELTDGEPLDAERTESKESA